MNNLFALAVGIAILGVALLEAYRFYQGYGASLGYGLWIKKPNFIERVKLLIVTIGLSILGVIFVYQSFN